MNNLSTITQVGLQHVLQLKEVNLTNDKIPSELLSCGNIELLKYKTIGLTGIKSYPGYEVIDHFLQVIEFVITNGYTLVISIDETFIIFLNHILILREKYNFNLIVCIKSFEPPILKFIYNHINVNENLSTLFIFFCNKSFDKVNFLLEYFCNDVILFSLSDYYYYIKENLSVKQLFISSTILNSEKLLQHYLNNKKPIDLNLRLTIYKDIDDLKDRLEFGRKLITV